jgi:hypothetical protein
MSTPPFFALPAELRNRIYELCIESKALQLPRHPRLKKEHYADVRCGLYGSLRNVCRQTRAEFGSMSMSKTVTLIHQITANAFLKAFYPELKQPVLAREELKFRRCTEKLLTKTSTAISAVQGNILIITYFGHRYDATPLVRLCAEYPAFKVTFTEASACLRFASLLNDFFASISSGAFRPYLDRVLQKIEITCSKLPEIRLLFQSERVMEDVMARVGTTDPRESLIMMGAPPMDAFNILFEAKTGRESVCKYSAPLV